MGREDDEEKEAAAAADADGAAEDEDSEDEEPNVQLELSAGDEVELSAEAEGPKVKGGSEEADAGKLSLPWPGSALPSLPFLSLSSLCFAAVPPSCSRPYGAAALRELLTSSPSSVRRFRLKLPVEERDDGSNVDGKGDTTGPEEDEEEEDANDDAAAADEEAGAEDEDGAPEENESEGDD